LAAFRDSILKPGVVPVVTTTAGVPPPARSNHPQMGFLARHLGDRVIPVLRRAATYAAPVTAPLGDASTPPTPPLPPPQSSFDADAEAAAEAHALACLGHMPLLMPAAFLLPLRRAVLDFTEPLLESPRRYVRMMGARCRGRWFAVKKPPTSGDVPIAQEFT